MGRFYNPNLPALDFGYRPTQTNVSGGTSPLTIEQLKQLKAERKAKQRAATKANEESITKVEFTDDPELVPKGTPIEQDMAKFDEVYANELKKTHPELANAYIQEVQEARGRDMQFRQAKSALAKADAEHKTYLTAQAVQIYSKTGNASAAMHYLNSSLADLGEDPITNISKDRDGRIRFFSRDEPEGYAMSPAEADRIAVGPTTRFQNDEFRLRVEEKERTKKDKPPNLKLSQTEIDAGKKIADTYIYAQGTEQQKEAWKKISPEERNTIGHDLYKRAKYLQHYNPDGDPIELQTQATKDVMGGLMIGDTPEWTEWVPFLKGVMRDKPAYKSPLGTEIPKAQKSAAQSSKEITISARAKGTQVLEGAKLVAKDKNNNNVYIKNGKYIYEDGTEYKP
jgi:hypothetical protein